MAIGALAKASAVLQAEDPPGERCFPVEGSPPSTYLEAAIRVSQKKCLLRLVAHCNAA